MSAPVTIPLTESVERAAERVRQGDPDRFAATMASPVALRPLLWPLYALNLEIGRAAWTSSEPMIGEMRLQWWIDGLHRLSDTGAPPDHEIGAALMPLRAVAGDLSAMADARRRDCWREPFENADDLFSYLRDTSGRLYAAAGEILGSPAPERQWLSDFGTAAGLAGWLRAGEDLSLRGWASLPLSGETARPLARSANRLLKQAEGSLRHASKPARLARLPGWQTKGILARAIRTDRSDALERSEFRRRLGLLYASLTV